LGEFDHAFRMGSDAVGGEAEGTVFDGTITSSMAGGDGWRSSGVDGGDKGGVQTGQDFGW